MKTWLADTFNIFWCRQIHGAGWLTWEGDKWLSCLKCGEWSRSKLTWPTLRKDAFKFGTYTIMTLMALMFVFGVAYFVWELIATINID